MCASELATGPGPSWASLVHTSALRQVLQASQNESGAEMCFSEGVLPSPEAFCPPHDRLPLGNSWMTTSPPLTKLSWSQRPLSELIPALPFGSSGHGSKVPLPPRRPLPALPGAPEAPPGGLLLALLASWGPSAQPSLVRRSLPCRLLGTPWGPGESVFSLATLGQGWGAARVPGPWHGGGSPPFLLKQGALHAHRVTSVQQPSPSQCSGQVVCDTASRSPAKTPRPVDRQLRAGPTQRTCRPSQPASSPRAFQAGLGDFSASRQDARAGRGGWPHPQLLVGGADPRSPAGPPSSSEGWLGLPRGQWLAVLICFLLSTK